MEEPKPLDSSATASYEHTELPVWFVQTGLLEGKNFYKDYLLDPRMQPHYLQADFNGDGYLDIAIPIKQKESGKKGFAIIHGNTGDVHLISAGTSVKNGLSDDMGYVDIWKINTEKVNSPGLDEDSGTGKNEELLLENPSLQIETSEIGGGQIYWNGKEYAYFHQTC